LWGGCPMVTLPLERMASRVAASLCYATGLGPEMVVNSQVSCHCALISYLLSSFPQSCALLFACSPSEVTPRGHQVLFKLGLVCAGGGGEWERVGVLRCSTIVVEMVADGRGGGVGEGRSFALLHYSGGDGGRWRGGGFLGPAPSLVIGGSTEDAGRGNGEIQRSPAVRQGPWCSFPKACFVNPLPPD